MWISLISVIVLSLTHLFAERLGFKYLPRSKWLSFAGGISVAYVFIHIFPELAENQDILREHTALSFLQHHVYIIALFGLLLFYGLEKSAKQSSQSTRTGINDEMPQNLNIFWIHVTSFAIYNGIIGYLLVHRNNNEGTSLIWFTLAMAFHFVVNDYSLIEHYKKTYKNKGRWIITLAILAGWAIGVLWEIPEYWIAILFSFIAGGTILNVLKEELPNERKSNFWAFSFGMLIYAGILLIQ